MLVFVAPRKQFAAAKGKCQLVEITGLYIMGDVVRRVRPYSKVYSIGAESAESGNQRACGKSTYPEQKQRSTLVRGRGLSVTGQGSVSLGVLTDRLTLLGLWSCSVPVTPRSAQSRRVRSRPSALFSEQQPSGGWSRVFKCYPNCIGRKGRIANPSSPLKVTACRRRLRPVRILPAYRAVCCYKSMAGTADVTRV